MDKIQNNDLCLTVGRYTSARFKGRAGPITRKQNREPQL